VFDESRNRQANARSEQADRNTPPSIGQSLLFVRDSLVVSCYTYVADDLNNFCRFVSLLLQAPNECG